MKTILDFKNVKNWNTKADYVKIIALDNGTFIMKYKYVSMKTEETKQYDTEKDARYDALRHMMFLLS